MSPPFSPLQPPMCARASAPAFATAAPKARVKKSATARRRVGVLYRAGGSAAADAGTCDKPIIVSVMHVWQVPNLHA